MHYEVIIDRGEKPNKCTIAPLADRADFELFWVKGEGLLGPLKSPILLHHEGKCLSEFLSKKTTVEGIATIDCVWRRLDVLLKKLAPPIPELVKIPDGFVTAYPRKSKLNTDPKAGLATIEAIFIASAFLGNWDLTLFDKYHFGPAFLELNRDHFRKFGILNF